MLLVNDSDGTPQKALYNSRILFSYLMLIKSHYSYINIDELLSYAGIKSYQLEDEGHWFTQNQINRFHEILRAKTNNQKIAREAGKYASSPGALGMMRRYVLGLIGPENAYELIGKYASKLTKSSKYNVKTLGLNKVEIQVTPNEGVKEKFIKIMQDAIEEDEEMLMEVWNDLNENMGDS